MLTIEQWGTGKWTSMKSAFAGCSNLTSSATDAPDLSNVTDLSNMFYEASIFNADIGSWNTSNVMDMSQMFYEANAFNQNIGSWDTSNVTDMSGMFQDAQAFNQDIGSWNTAKVTSMASMFYNAFAFNQAINTSGDSWNTAKVTTMQHMFNNAEKFNQNIGSWNTAAVKDMSDMFYQASDFNGAIGAWNTSNVTTMARMFEQAQDFNQNIGGWNTGKVTDMGNMFYEARVFNQNIGGWNTSNVLNMNNMFNTAYDFNQDIGSWNTGKVTDMSEMFGYASDFNQDIGGWNTANVINLSWMFKSAEAFNQDIGSWNTAKVTNMANMFDDASDFDQDLGGWDVGQLTNAAWMFDDAQLSITNYDALLIGWNAQTLKSGVSFGGGDSKYCAGEAARANIFSASSHDWTLDADGGKGCNIIVTTLADSLDANSSTCTGMLIGHLPGSDGVTSLREAICAANGSAGSDEITFSLSGTINLGSTLPLIDSTMDIDGSGQTITVSGNNAHRVFINAYGGNLSINNLTIANGYISGNGGGINNSGTLAVNNSIFSGNQATISGAGIYNGATISNIANSTFSGNQATINGGGIYNIGTINSITNSTFSGNTADGDGGGINNYTGGTITSIANSTFSDNEASSSSNGGGGIINFPTSTITSIANSTFSGNSASYAGGGGILNGGMITTITNSTFSGNSAASGGGINNAGAITTIANTLVANSTGDNCAGTSPGTNTNNIRGHEACWSWANSLDGSIHLGPLAYNGGTTKTHALLGINPAIDAGDGPTCSAYPVSGLDQRGVARGFDGNGVPNNPETGDCDIGAYEADGKAYVDTYIAGALKGSYGLESGKRTYPRYGINGGPVLVTSTNGIPIFTSQRVIYKNSFTETLGIPNTQLDTEYWFTSLDDFGMTTYLVIGNPDDTDTAYVDVYIAGAKMNASPYAIGPEGRVYPRYGINGGPVKVVSVTGSGTPTPLPIITSQRVIYKDSFTETLPFPAKQFTTEYWYTSLDDSGMTTYLVIGNPDDTDTAYVDVYIAGAKMNASPYAIGPGGRVYPRYGINGGPVKVVSVTGSGTPTPLDIFTSQRVIYKDSFTEALGIPNAQLETTYWFTSLDDLSMTTYMVIGNPDDTDTAYVDVYIAGVKMNASPYAIGPEGRVYPRYGINGGPVKVVSVTGSGTPTPLNIFTSQRVIYKDSFTETLGIPNTQLDTSFWYTSLDDFGMNTYLVIGALDPGFPGN